MHSLQSTAAFYRIGLRLGLLSAAEAIRWADIAIEQAADPPADLLEVALAPPAKPHELISRLGALAGPTDLLPAVYAVFDRLRSDLEDHRRSAAETASLLYTLSYSAELPEDLHRDIVALDDNFSLALQGVWGDIDHMTAELHHWLDRFRGAEAAIHPTRPA